MDLWGFLVCNNLFFSELSKNKEFQRYLYIYGISFPESGNLGICILKISSQFLSILCSGNATWESLPQSPLVQHVTVPSNILEELNFTLYLNTSIKEELITLLGNLSLWAS